MTTCEYTKDELQVIADALATYQSYVNRLYPQPIAEHRARLSAISELRSKTLAYWRGAT